MTNKEAITYLEWLSDIDFTKEYPKYPIVTKQEQVEALQMAIKALHAQDKLQDVEYMCRLSGGADYFRVFAALLEKTNNSNDGVKNANANSTNEIKSRVKGMTACRVPEDDVISRQAAIDLIESIETERLKGNVGLIYAPAIKGLRALPSVQPERKTGHWERHNTYHGDDVSGFIDPDWRCSECGGQANVNAWFMYDLTDFCPHCGADMREGEQDGQN